MHCPEAVHRILNPFWYARGGAAAVADALPGSL
jgi:hypothetical protein